MIIFDEIKYADELSKNKEIVKTVSGSDLILLAKYYKYKNKKAGSTTLINKLIAYCEKRIVNFTKELYYDHIKKCVTTSLKGVIKENNKIGITEKELVKIREIDNDEIRRLLFVMLCVAKYYDCNKVYSLDEKRDTLYLKKCTYQDLFKLAKIKYSVDKKNKYIYYLNSNEYIYTMSNQSSNIMFVDLNGEGKLNVSCYDDLVYEFDYYFGLDNKLKKCTECSKLFEQNNNKHVYCKICSVEIKKEQNKKADIKYKEKLKTRK